MIMRLTRCALLLAFLMLIGTPAPAADWPAGIPIDEFPISYWCGPMPEFATLERYKEIKDAGFTFVMPSRPRKPRRPRDGQRHRQVHPRPSAHPPNRQSHARDRHPRMHRLH